MSSLWGFNEVLVSDDGSVVEFVAGGTVVDRWEWDPSQWMMVRIHEQTRSDQCGCN